jgi:hypothetical protein
MAEREIDRDKRRVLEYLRSSRKFMPYLHESMPASGAVALLGSRDRAQRALVALVQDQKIVYLENCSPDHYQAFADPPQTLATILDPTPEPEQQQRPIRRRRLWPIGR